MLSHYQMKEIPYLRILGRTNGSLEPVTLFWTASGIELNVKATEIWVKIRSDYDVFEPWVDVIVDGVLSQRLMVNKGEQEICLFRNMERDKVRNVKLLRDTPAFPTDEKTLLQLLEVETDGEFLPLETPKLRLEVIGDSITSGEGGSGAGEEMTWNSFCFNAVDNYAYMAAKELGAMEKWDFQKFQPDVIVVNLGTNDSSGTKNMDRIGKAVEDFLRKLRVCNPESYILWCYGMLGDEILPTLEKAVGNYKRKTGDERVEFVKLPDTLEGEFGSRQHPGHRSHERTAKILVEKIQEKMTLLVTP